MRHTSEFLFGIIDELEKQLLIKIKLLKWTNKKCKNFNIYNIVFFLIKKTTWRHHFFTPVYQKLDDMIYTSWDIECDRLKLVIMIHFLPFHHSPLKTKKIRTLKKWKINCWRYEAQQTEFFAIFDHFLPFYSTNSKNQNFQKMKKKTPGDIIILHKCTKNHDYMLYCSWYVVHDRCNC